MAWPRIRHAGLKIVSVVLAALLWLVVSGEQTVERALRVPLEFTNLPSQLELVGELPATVDVRVRGSSGTLSRIAAGELAAVLDVREARSGERLFHLTAEDVRAPFGVEVVQVAPASVALTFELSQKKVVPVTGRVEGEPAPGFVVNGVTVEPSTVTVAGPASALSRLDEAITESVSVSGARGPVTENVTIGVADPDVRVPDVQRARVTVLVTAQPEEWTIDGVPVQAKNARGSAQMAPTVVSILVRGVKQVATAADTSQYHASVDLTGLSPGRHRVPVRVEPPAGVGLLRVNPAELDVTIR
jgi:YbbR domain-containing protein